MNFDKFKIFAYPFVADAFCECGDKLIRVSDGLMSEALFCPKCENVYKLKLIKLPKKDIVKIF